MTRCRHFLILLTLTLAGYTVVASAQSHAPNDVQVKLVLAHNKSTFRIGEPIELVMEFTASVEGYHVDRIPDGKEPTSDNVSIAPDVGVSHWLDEIRGKPQLGRDVFSPVSLSSTPTRVSLILNDTLRIDRPGQYKAKITTKRVSPASSLRESTPPLVLTTNEVKFEVVPMSEEEEKKEIKRLSDLLNAKRDWQSEEIVTRELSYLTGDTSSREKVRRFLNPENRSGNYSAHITYGL